MMVMNVERFNDKVLATKCVEIQINLMRSKIFNDWVICQRRRKKKRRRAEETGKNMRGVLVRRDGLKPESIWDVFTR